MNDGLARTAAAPPAASAADDALLRFLVDTVAQWNIDATVQAHPGGAAEVAAASGTVTIVERAARADRDIGFRWTVQIRGAGKDAPRMRRCVSLLALLGVLRTALGVERQSPILVASSCRGPVELE